MSAPKEPFLVPWKGRSIRVRHDDPRLGPYTPRGQTIMAAMQLAHDEAGLARVLEVTVGDAYDVRVTPGPEVRLRRRRG